MVYSTPLLTTSAGNANSNWEKKKLEPSGWQKRNECFVLLLLFIVDNCLYYLQYMCGVFRSIQSAVKLYMRVSMVTSNIRVICFYIYIIGCPFLDSHLSAPF